LGPKRNDVVPETNPLPLNVTNVPPAAGPELGEIELSVGVGWESTNESRPANVPHAQPTSPAVVDPFAAYSPATHTLVRSCGSMAALA